MRAGLLRAQDDGLAKRFRSFGQKMLFVSLVIQVEKNFTLIVIETRIDRIHTLRNRGYRFGETPGDGAE